MIGKIDKIVDTDKPILITGWTKVKGLYPKQKITNKKITESIFWTFSQKEKRTENETDLKKFKEFCIKNFEKKYKYYFLNPFELTYWNIKKFINRVNYIENGKFFYFDGKHIFILIENFIFGINLDFLSLTNVSENKLIEWLKSKKFEIIENFEIFNKEEITNKKYLIPALVKENYEKQLIIGYIFE